MFIPTYYGTKKVSSVGEAPCIYLEKQWGFSKDDIVNLTLYRLDDPEKIRYMGTKKVSQCGSGNPIFLEKMWGFTKGEMVVMTVQLVPNRSD